MLRRTRIFIGLKILEVFLFVLANFILYWVGTIVNRFIAFPEEKGIFITWLNGLLGIIAVLFIFLIGFGIFIGPIKSLIKKNWEWAEKIERKRK
ncbi:hypothetical protein LCGC14_0714850 [marine sediment metagenome]|uniref:Uncharacterized protein n=1 Tax=marine sediment metagenome TaxID=412755 RepID=A0A0F9QE31_9ZZZZ